MAKIQNKPNGMLSKPDSKPKNADFDNFSKTFLCKTNPIYENFRLSMRHHLIGKMQNEPNLNKILTYLTNEMKRTYSDFYQKEAKKTNPILTIS